MAELVPSLVSLRAEFDILAPKRSRESDGWIGDTRHAQTPSDHNPDETGNTPYEDADNIDEVHAIDITAELNKSGWSMDKCVEIIVMRHKNGDDNRLQNVIWNRRIWSASWGWTPIHYSGVNPHTKHAHFSARYTNTAEKDTRPWGLVVTHVALTTAEIAALANASAEATRVELTQELQDKRSALYSLYRAIPLQYPVFDNKSLLTIHQEMYGMVEDIKGDISELVDAHNVFVQRVNDDLADIKTMMTKLLDMHTTTE